MADVDPRIRQFNQEAEKVLASVRRANAEAKSLQGQLEQDRAAERRISSELRSRGGSGAVANEPVGAERGASEGVVSGSEQRSKALTDEEIVQRRLNATRREGVTALEAEAAAYRNTSRYGAYAGGRKTFEQYGYVGGGGVPPSIPPGGKLPPPGGFPALPQKTGGPEPTKIGSSLDATAEKYYRLEQRSNAYRTSVSKLTQEQNLSSTAFRRNGALTTEFIAAAQRGEVTIRELGYQTASTIGKFGGWLAAGSAVYGAFAAVSALGKGALEAYSGVNLLSRVVTQGIDAESLRQEFAGLAGEFNLPIGTVTDAVYQMGKVFHSQTGAISAARAVLYSVKVGELDTADATRYLIAIVNGFHLPASRMAEVFDQINAAQNRFGISIADVEAGLAKASGTFNAAGGSYSNLLALITTAQKATGNTGQVVGTALARAPNFLAKAQNQDVLRSFGIRPGQSIDKIITEAFDVSQTLSGSRLQQLAAAIFGPQYGARIGTPLLQQKALYDKVLAGTSPKAAKGSAAQELKTQLGGVDEQITKIGTTLEQLGATLANAHAFDFVGGLIASLNTTLQLALHISEAFDALPDGLKQGLAYALQLAVVMRTLRRFDLGESFAPGPGQTATGTRGFLQGVFGKGPIGEARSFRGGLLEEQKAIQEQQARVTTEAVRAAERHDLARQKFGSEIDQNRILSAQGNAEGVEASNRNLERYEGEMVKQKAILDDTAFQTEYNANRQSRITESLQKSKRYGMFSINAALEERERTAGKQYYPGTYQRPVSGVEPKTGAGIGAAVGAEAAAATAASRTILPPEVVNQLDTAEREASVGRQRANLVQSGVGKLGGALNGLLNKVGTIFFGLSIGLLVKSLIDEMVSSIDDDRKQIEQAAPSAQKLKALAHSQASGHGGLGTTIVDFFTGSGGSHGPLEDLLGIGSSNGVADSLREAEETSIVAARDTLKLQGIQKAKGEPVAFLYATQIEKAIKQVVKSNASKAQKLKQLSVLEAENEKSQEATVAGRLNPKKVKAVDQQIEIAKASIGDIKDLNSTLAKLPEKTVETWFGDYTALITDLNGHFDANAASRAATILAYELQRLGKSTNPDDIKKLAEAQKTYFEAISNGAKEQLSIGLEGATSPQERAGALAAALQSARTGLIRAPQKQVQEAEASARKAREKYQRAKANSYQSEIESGKVLGPPTPNRFDPTNQLETEFHSQALHLKELRKNAKEAREYYERIEKQLRQQEYEAVAAVRDSRFQYRQSLTADPVKQAAIELERVNADLPGAIRAFGHDSQQVYSLLQERQQALSNQVQGELSLITAQGNLAASGINPNNTVAKDQATVANIQRQLDFEQSHANRFSPSSIIELEAQLRSAQVQLALDVQQEAVELQNTVFQRKINEATVNDHPVRAAELAIRQTRYQIAHAKTPVEKKQLEAQLVTEYGNRRDTKAKLALENIEFEASINKITTQQEIGALENLIRDYKLSRDMRRQIRQQIHNLKNESSEFPLDVGNIVLPTIYDVRRAVQGGVQNHPGIQVNNSPRITVNNFSSDEAVVGKALGRVLGGATSSAMRSAGMKG